ncbi:MAG: FadR/GntR family transcriptional regulator [Chloroflexota bacterium]
MEPTGFELSPVRRSRLYERIIEQIRTLISEGRWGPGAQLPAERELAERLRVSRTSVREALRILEMQGVLETRQGGGTFVRTTDMEALVAPLANAILQGRRELAQILEVRELLEPGIARAAAQRATPDHILELERLVEQQRDCVRRGDSFVDADTAFHNTLAVAADNPILDRLHAIILDLLRESRQSYLYTADRPQKSLRGHEAILAAITSHNPNAAWRASLNHISEVRDGILHALDDRADGVSATPSR